MQHIWIYIIRIYLIYNTFGYMIHTYTSYTTHLNTRGTFSLVCAGLGVSAPETKRPRRCKQTSADRHRPKPERGWVCHFGKPSLPLLLAFFCYFGSVLSAFVTCCENWTTDLIKCEYILAVLKVKTGEMPFNFDTLFSHLRNSFDISMFYCDRMCFGGKLKPQAHLFKIIM